MTSQTSEPARRPPVRIVIAVFLGLMSTFVVVDHMALSKLKREAVGRQEDPAIAKRLIALEQQVVGVATQPPGASVAELAAVRAELDGRVVKVEQLVGSRVSADDMVVLQGRLGTYEAKLSKMKRQIAEAREPQPAPVPSGPPQPPFATLSIELRGGERVLALLPSGSQSLAEVRLLRVGERQANWQLEALGEHTADFSVDGRQQRVMVP